MRVDTFRKAKMLPCTDKHTYVSPFNCWILSLGQPQLLRLMPDVKQRKNEHRFSPTICLAATPFSMPSHPTNYNLHTRSPFLLYSKAGQRSCDIWHLQKQRVPEYRNFLDMHNVYLTVLQLHRQTRSNNLSPDILSCFFQLQFLLHFHQHNVYMVFKKPRING